jgi:methionyl-tRNA formyltransferase
MRVIFAGTPETAIRSLEKVAENFEVVAVVTRKDALTGRGKKLTASPVKIKAQELGLKVLEEPTYDELKNFLDTRNAQIDLGIIVAYGQILKQDQLEIMQNGWINLHFSLLPMYRGAAPVQHAILNGEKSTGVTVFKLLKGLDDGPILSQNEVEIEANETSGQLLHRLSEIGSEVLVKSAKQIELHTAQYIEQSGFEQLPKVKQYAGKLCKSTSKINWTKEPAEIVNFINAYSPNPGAWFEFETDAGQIIRIVAVSAKLDQNQQVELVEVRPAGKNTMKWSDFLRGRNGVIFERPSGQM